MKQKWETVKVHRSYQIQINTVPSPYSKYGFGYRINDPSFLPDHRRYDTVEEAVNAIDERTK